MFLYVNIWFLCVNRSFFNVLQKKNYILTFVLITSVLNFHAFLISLLFPLVSLPPAYL